MAPTPQRNEVDLIMEGKSIYTSYALRSNNKLIRYLMMKRAFDIIAAFIGLLILSPLLLMIAIIIKLDDPKGSIFFHQTRVGKGEKTFKMYKFRSMVSDAEYLLGDLLQQNEVNGPMFKMKEDPRITKIGKFIRKTSVDELPQLWNVIRGDMSLVGPRPPLEREVAEYSSYDKLRLRVTPGCTGLWQVSGRNDLSFSQMLELDLEYIEYRSIWFDIKIMFKTIKVILLPNSAY